MEIWDLHCHLGGMPGATPEARLGHLLRYADRFGISRVCVSMGMSWEYDPSPEKFQQDNADVLRAIRAYPDRALGLVYLNPRFVPESLEQLDRHVANGPMVGIKLWVARRCIEPELDPIVRRAAELLAPVFQHTWIKVTGNLPGESTPMDLAMLAARYPNAKFICGHTGGDWEIGLRAVRDSQNVWVELGGGDPVSGFTEMAVRELGAGRVIFGSDAPGRSFASQLGKIYGARLSARDQSSILGGNLRRLLEPILSRKGFKV